MSSIKQERENYKKVILTTPERYRAHIDSILNRERVNCVHDFDTYLHSLSTQVGDVVAHKKMPFSQKMLLIRNLLGKRWFQKHISAKIFGPAHKHTRQQHPHHHPQYHHQTEHEPLKDATTLNKSPRLETIKESIDENFIDDDVGTSFPPQAQSSPNQKPPSTSILPSSSLLIKNNSNNSNNNSEEFESSILQLMNPEEKRRLSSNGKMDVDLMKKIKKQDITPHQSSLNPLFTTAFDDDDVIGRDLNKSGNLPYDVDVLPTNIYPARNLFQELAAARLSNPPPKIILPSTPNRPSVPNQFYTPSSLSQHINQKRARSSLSATPHVSPKRHKNLSKRNVIAPRYTNKPVANTSFERKLMDYSDIVDDSLIKTFREPSPNKNQSILSSTVIGTPKQPPRNSMLNFSRLASQYENAVDDPSAVDDIFVTSRRDISHKMNKSGNKSKSDSSGSSSNSSLDRSLNLNDSYEKRKFIDDIRLQAGDDNLDQLLFNLDDINDLDKSWIQLREKDGTMQASVHKPPNMRRNLPRTSGDPNWRDKTIYSPLKTRSGKQIRVGSKQHPPLRKSRKQPAVISASNYVPFIKAWEQISSLSARSSLSRFK